VTLQTGYLGYRRVGVMYRSLCFRAMQTGYWVTRTRQPATETAKQRVAARQAKAVMRERLTTSRQLARRRLGEDRVSGWARFDPRLFG
jgi:hypothetical protein